MEQRRIEHVVRLFANSKSYAMRRSDASDRLCGSALFALSFKARMTLPVGGKGARGSFVRDARMSRVVTTRGVCFGAGEVKRALFAIDEKDSSPGGLVVILPCRV